MPKARILAVGDELLLGRTIDTNSAFLAAALADLGLSVLAVTVVGDDEDELTRTIETAAGEADLVLITGGLGPTRDDRTRHALARACDRPLVEHPNAWAQVEAYYRSRLPDQEIPEANRRQALAPKGARMLSNDRGTAPGIRCTVADATVISMPGVPHEMRAMFGRFVKTLPKLFPELSAPHISECWVAGLGESLAQDMLGDLLEGGGGLQVGITAHDMGHLTVRVVGAERAVKGRLRAIKRELKPFLLPAEGLAASLVKRCGAKGWTLTAAESCTCGNVLAAIGAIPGASAVLKEGLIAYHNKRKRQRLGVTDEVLELHGAVSEECAAFMAAGARTRSGASLAIATTGIAGPSGGTEAKPVGTVWVAAATTRGVSTRLLTLKGSRTRIQMRAAAGALLLAWEHLHGAAAKQLSLTC